MRRSLLLVAALLLLAPAASAGADGYDPAGQYLDATSWPLTASYSWVQFDAAGIPQTCKGACVYNPVTISEYGLQEWSFYAAGQDDAHLANAVAAADWLVANQQPSGDWTYGYDFPVAGTTSTMRAPWISAMAQGVAMSLLTRVWRQTGAQRYLDAASAALAPFRLAVADGGVVAGFAPVDASLPFYEEYPTDPPSFTLNGFMFSLIGLYDLSVAAPDSDAGTLYSAGRTTLDAALPFYDQPSGLSIYHLGYLYGLPVHTSLKYHHVHVVELTALDSIEADPTLEHYRDRWAAYTPPVAAVVRPAPVPPAAAVPPPPATVAASTTAAWSCRVGGHRIRRHGRVSCAHARRVLDRKLHHRPIRSAGWRCHDHPAAVTCRRADGAWVRVRR